MLTGRQMTIANLTAGGMRYVGVSAQFIQDIFRKDRVRLDDMRSLARHYHDVATEIAAAFFEGLASAQHYDRLARMIGAEPAERAAHARIAVLRRPI
jgi:hypothetical protein